MIRARNGSVQDGRDFFNAGRMQYDPAGIRVPTLLVVGDRDADTPPHMARGYFERLVNAPCRRMVVIGDGTHNLMIERQRMQLFREVQLFLEDDAPAPHGETNPR